MQEINRFNLRFRKWRSQTSFMDDNNVSRASFNFIQLHFTLDIEDNGGIDVVA